MRSTASGRKPATIFYIVNVLLLPITLVGYVIWLARIRSSSGQRFVPQLQASTLTLIS